MKQIPFIALLVGLLLVLPGCREFPVDSEEEASPGFREFVVNLDTPFEMAIGDIVSLRGTDLEVRFSFVTEDSRCPLVSPCGLNGRAGILLEVTDHQEVTTQVVMYIPGKVGTPYDNNDWIQHKGQRFRLLRLNPYPEVGQSTAESDYRALLEVEPIL